MADATPTCRPDPDKALLFSQKRCESYTGIPIFSFILNSQIANLTPELCCTHFLSQVNIRSVAFNLTCVHIIYSSVCVAESPPLWK